MRQTNRAERAVKRLSVSTVAFLLAAVMIFGCALGGTFAWLTKKADRVDNTFTLGDIILELVGPENPATQFLAGTPADYNPKVKVGAGSVGCYVFVKIYTDETFKKTADYETDSQWTELPSTLANSEGVYYIKLTEIGSTSKELTIFSGNQLLVKNTFGDTIDYESEKADISVRAFACQLNGFEDNVAGAWNAIVAAYPTEVAEAYTSSNP